MFSDISLTDDKPLYIQIRDYIKQMILKGLLPGSKITFHQGALQYHRRQPQHHYFGL